MSYKEFRKSSKRSIAEPGMLFDFTKVREGIWLIEVSLPSLYKMNGEAEVHEWVTCTNVVTDIEAYNVYENIENGVLRIPE
jgi:hypothetical protein